MASLPRPVPTRRPRWPRRPRCRCWWRRCRQAVTLARPPRPRWRRPARPWRTCRGPGAAPRRSPSCPPERAPHVERFTPPGAGSLLICSDGLWNYLAEGAELARLALPKALTDPLGAAADMVKFAVDAGGADNITVVLIPYLGPETP